MTNRTRDTLLGNRIEVANRWWPRMRGYLGRPEPKTGEGLLLVPCRAVHMIGMQYPLDVIFIDRAGQIVSTFASLAPGKIVGRQRKAAYALELPIGTIEASRSETYDHLVWTPAEGGSSGPPLQPRLDAFAGRWD